MKAMDEIKLYENKQIRSVWDDEKEEWYFSVVDVVGVLTENENPQVYWRVLKKRLKEEGNESVTNCNALKMKAADGKMRLTDVSDMQGIFRIIQSIPSPKAEPFKLWLAEATTTELTKATNPKGLEENKKVAKKGGSVAGNARKEIEKETGKPVITSKNTMDLSRLIEDVVKEPINKTEADKEKNK